MVKRKNRKRQRGGYFRGTQRQRGGYFRGMRRQRGGFPLTAAAIALPTMLKLIGL